MKSRFNLHSLIPTSLLAAYVVLATAFSLINPIYESTDELQHYRFVQYVIATGQLPVQTDQGARIQAHHPPLYYALAGLASFWVQPDHAWDFEPEPNPYWGYRYWEVSADNKARYIHLSGEDWPYRGTALANHLARWVNVAFGAVTVWLTYRLAQRMFPNRPGLALSAMAIVAFNPQFLYMSGSINNDVAASATGAALLYACVDLVGRASRAEERQAQAGRPSTPLRFATFRSGRLSLLDQRAAIIGGLFGLGLLAKFNLVFMLPIIVAALWLARGDGGARRFARAGLIVLAVTALIAGWWFARNQMLYGEPTGVEKMNAIWGGRDPLRDFPLALQEIPYAWSALWGRFGYGQIPMPDAVYQAILAVCLIGLAGLLVGRWRRWRSADPIRRAQAGVTALTVCLFAAAVFGYMTVSTAGPNGRFFFPALSALGVMLAAGLLEWARRRETLAAIASCGLAFVLAIYALYGIVAPAYARPTIMSDAQIASIPNRGEIVFGDAVRLLGYQVDAEQVSVGGRVTVTLYWQALRPIDKSYAVFVHLIDGDGVIEAQRDTYPGLGNYPTPLWHPGEVFADHYAVDVPDTAYAPLDTTVRVGLYEKDGARLVASNGEDSLAIGQVAIAAREGAYPNATRYNFDNKVALLGYSLDRRSAKPGESITLTTYWQAVGPTDFDYRIFAHVAASDDPATIWARTTDGPAHGARPLSGWAAGEVVIDERVLTLDPNTPPGVYELQIGWFGKPSSRRLPILAEDGHWLGTHLALTRLRVTNP